MQYSDLVTQQQAVGATRPAPTDIQGRVRIACFKLTAAAAETAMATVEDPLTRGALKVHIERAATAKREVRLLQRFTSSHPSVPLVGVPSASLMS